MTPSGRLRLALVIGLLLINTVVLLLAANSLLVSRQHYEERAQLLTQNVANALDLSLVGTIAKIDLSLQAVVDELQRQLALKNIDEPSLNAFLAVQEQRLPEVEAFRVARADGLVILGGGLDKALRLSYADRQYFRVLQANSEAGLQVSEPIIGRISKRHVIAFARPYLHPDRSFAGVVTAAVPVDHFAAVLSEFDLGPKGLLVLRSADLGLIARVPAIRDRPGGAVGNTQVSREFKQIVDSGSSAATYYTAQAADGNARMSTFRRQAATGMFVIASRDESDYLSGWTLEKYRTVAMSLGFLVLSLLLGAFIFRLWQAESAEHDVRIAISQANAANQAKSVFLANMSHDIRTPMNAVVALAYLMAQTRLDANQQALLGKMGVASRSLLDVINDVLDLSKIEAGEMESNTAPFDPRKLLDEIVGVIRMQTGARQLQLDFEVAAGLPPWLVGDAARLRRILDNLLGNAIKFTEQGRVLLRVDVVDAVDVVEGGTPPVRVRFCVVDTGIGMSPEVLTRLFKPFSQGDASTTRRYGGTGLGLAIAKQLTETMGGTIAVTSSPGVGSRFEVVLPFSAAEEGPATFAATSAAGGERGPPILERLSGVSVLIVDDSPINLEVAQQILEHEGARVEVAEDGAEAVSLLRAGPRDYDIVLMDVQMPVLDGLDATRQIREELGLKRLPVIALTAGALLSERRRAIEAGMNTFITKPFNPLEVIDMIRLQVELARGERLPPPPSSSKPPVVPEAEAWPEIDGIDRDDVRGRLQGNLPLFMRLLGSLCNEYRDLARPVPVPRSAVERTALQARLHKLNGSAGMLGAGALREAAAAVDAAIRGGLLPAEIATKLAALSSAMATLVLVSQPALTRAGSRADLSTTAPGEPLDAAELAKWLVQLRSHHIDSLERFRQLSGALRSAWGQARFDPVAEAMERLDFSAALALVPIEHRSVLLRADSATSGTIHQTIE